MVSNSKQCVVIYFQRNLALTPFYLALRYLVRLHVYFSQIQGFIPGELVFTDVLL